jgi:hypothetical protein
VGILEQFPEKVLVDEVFQKILSDIGASYTDTIDNFSPLLFDSERCKIHSHTLLLKPRKMSTLVEFSECSGPNFRSLKNFIESTAIASEAASRELSRYPRRKHPSGYVVTLQGVTGWSGSDAVQYPIRPPPSMRSPEAEAAVLKCALVRDRGGLISMATLPSDCYQVISILDGWVRVALAQWFFNCESEGDDSVLFLSLLARGINMEKILGPRVRSELISGANSVISSKGIHLGYIQVGRNSTDISGHRDGSNDADLAAVVTLEGPETAVVEVESDPPLSIPRGSIYIFQPAEHFHKVNMGSGVGTTRITVILRYFFV